MIFQGWSHAAEIDFNRDIRPILTSRCYLCHGPDPESRQADLRLDNFQDATESVIDLTSPNESDLLLRVASDDPDFQMPPPGHGDQLSETEIQQLRDWIASGANYAVHWAYRVPKRPEIPQRGGATAEELPLHPIDAFVLEDLARDGLTLSPPADRYTIIRRVALDVTGLPPTRSEVEAFVQDTSDTAYERMVDDYLSRAAYGERWASVWLDLARYADSAGYADDPKRTIWLFRDYVIRAYNENKPFDQFTLEQLAGDLLPRVSDESRIATAFHRNTLTNSEGGTDDEEFRSAAVVDRVNTTMAVWMGTTMACAQCHTHKYDPITQAEYFQLYDFFNQTADSDKRDERPLLTVYSPPDRRKREDLAAEIASRKQQPPAPVNEAELRQWIDSLPAHDGEREDSSERPQAEPVSGRFVRIGLPSGARRILSLAEVQVFSSDATGTRQNIATEGKATQSSTRFDGPPQLAIDGNTDGQYDHRSVTHTRAESAPWWQVDLGRMAALDEVAVWNRTDGDVAKRLDGYRISVLDAQKQVVWSREVARASRDVQSFVLNDPTVEAMAVLRSGKALDEAQRDKLKKAYQQIVQARQANELVKLQEQMDSIRPLSTVPIMEELAAKDRRTTHIHIRGNYRSPGAVVRARIPEVFSDRATGSETGSETDAVPNRLDLARWLVSSENPLTARVVVNRYWEQLFGRGLVATSEDFGAQGELPSHPRLLDWLALELMESGWDTRALVKSIVMSSVYRQSSAVTPHLLAIDPENRRMARGPRVRLSAEMVRDQALAVSGLLSAKMHGPPVQPPQPKVGLKPAFTGSTTDWKDSVGDDRYRRAVYTEWRRSAPYASLTTFDMGNREVCEVRRIHTNTPLQALVTMNDPVYVEAAQALAQQIVAATADESQEQSVIHAFQACLIRPPSQREVRRLVRFVQATRKHFAAHPDAARDLATDPLRPPAPDADIVELATWTATANVLLNLDEMLMKP